MKWKLAAGAAVVAAVASLGLAGTLAQSPLSVRTRLPFLTSDSSTYRPAFHYPIAIDYEHPESYLEPGSQSGLNSASRAAIATEVGAPQPGLRGAAAIYRWITSAFRAEPSGGRDIGKTTADGLIASRVMTGCHDFALVLTAVARSFGIPAVMVDSAGIQWARDFHAGLTQEMRGHVFAELYVEGRWILVDCTTGLYAWDYDPLQPALPFTNPGEPVGHYVLFKGTDPAGYGVTDSEVLAARLRDFAAAIDRVAIHVPVYDLRDLRDVR
jgi:transglutaminase-like putative cysteine protease